MIFALAGTGLISAVHMNSRQGWKKGLQGFALTHDAAMVLLDLLALFFYLTHILEKWWPHTFDLWVSRLFTIPNILRVNDGKLIRNFEVCRGQATRSFISSSMSARFCFCWVCGR